MERSLDYLTLTAKPCKYNNVDGVDALNEFMGFLLNEMYFDKILEFSENKGRCKFYEVRYEYSDISLKIPEPDKFGKQGICIEMSGNGLASFVEYLTTIGYTLRLWCAKWREGLRGFETRCTRLDNALDEKQYNGDRPHLTIKRVINACYDYEVVSSTRDKTADLNDIFTLKSIYKKTNGTALLGTTIGFGAREKRANGTYIRIYDKRIEHLQKKKELPENLTHWVRCEMEHKADDAMIMFNAFIDCDDKKYGKYVNQFTMKKLRFINRDDLNVSRCSVKRWWREFLNGCTAHKLVCLKPVRCAKKRALNAIEQSRRTIRTLMHMWGDEGFCEYIHSFDEEDEQKPNGALRQDVLIDFELDNNVYEDMDGYKNYFYTSELPTREYTAKRVEQRLAWTYQDENIRADRLRNNYSGGGQLQFWE